MNYYMTQRPPSLGTHPKAGLVCTLEYDGKQFIPKIGMKAWACLTYNRELTDKEVREYELVPEFYRVELTRAELDSILHCLCYVCDEISNPEEIDVLCGLNDKLRKIVEGGK